jgi:hypothetical protein
VFEHQPHVLGGVVIHNLVQRTHIGVLDKCLLRVHLAAHV